MDKQTQQTLMKIVENNYREIADDFNDTRKKYLWPELVKLAAQVRVGDSVLDVGCGNGRLLEALMDKKGVYIGVDSSAELIRLAQENFDKEEKKNSNHHFVVGNILDLGQLPQFNFDWVFCVAVLHHLPGESLQVDALKQLKNKVSANGKVVITVWNLWSRKKYVALMLKFWFLRFIGKNKMDLGDILFDWRPGTGEKLSQRYYHAFRWSELRKIIAKAGFVIEKQYSDRYNYYLVLAKEKPVEIKNQ